MAKAWKKIATVALATAIAVPTATVLAACGGKGSNATYTYNTYTAQLPSVWTDVMTSDAADADGYSYLQSSFYEFDFAFEGGKFNDDGSINVDGIVKDKYTVNYSAATKLEDVTAEYAGQYGVPEGATQGHAFRITLRDDLKWDDGTPIDAEDFVFTMQQQLSPKYLFQQASNYYSGNYIIHNAQNYVMQGQSGWFAADTPYTVYDPATLDSLIVFNMASTTENESAYGGATCSMRSALGLPSTASLEQVVNALIAQMDFPATLEQVQALQGKTMAQIKADANLKSYWEAIIGWWQTDPNEELDFFITNYTFPEVSWDKVGYQAHSQYELDFIIDNTIHPVDANGDLTYEAAYYLQSFPLVKQDVWEACEVAPSAAGGLYTNTYGTGSVDKIPSWGPYKLTDFQNQVSYTLSRNENWYGYDLPMYANQFQTEEIFCRYIPEWNTAWQSFLLGDLDGVSLDSTVITDYGNSERVYYTPDTATFSVNLQSKAATDERAGNDMLQYTDFRKALSLSMDRDDFCAVNSPSSEAALGYLNDMYYYDVENSGIYRNTTQAREALLRAYGATENEDGSWTVGENTYTDVAEAESALTGYNLTLARQLMQSAYEQAKEDGVYEDGDTITLTYGITEQTARQTRVKDWLQTAFNAATVGTGLENKIVIEFFTMDAQTWSQQFSDGAFDICMSAWGNAPFNPYYLFGATQISETNRWAQGWDPSQVSFTLDIAGDPDAGMPAYEDLTMNLYQWDAAVQGLQKEANEAGAPAEYNFSGYPISDKLAILAAEEQAVLEAYWGLPVYSAYSASLMGYKVDYVTYEYNTFVGYGGVQYMTYNYTNSEWKDYCAAQGGLNYRN